MNCLLQATGIAIERAGRSLLAPLDLALQAGQVLGIIGPNGAGKSTLLRTLAGLEKPRAGRIRIDGQDLDRLSRAKRARLLGYHAQNPQLHWPLSVEDVVALGRIAHGSSLAKLQPEDRRAIAEAIRLTALESLLGRSADTLSGGELARVHIARLFAGCQRLLLADEPTANLDPRFQAEILTLLARHADTGGAVAVVLHDLNLAARHCDRLLLLADGQARICGRPGEVLTAAHIESSFGVPARYLQDTGIDRALADGRSARA